MKPNCEKCGKNFANCDCFAKPPSSSNSASFEDKNERTKLESGTAVGGRLERIVSLSQLQRWLTRLLDGRKVKTMDEFTARINQRHRKALAKKLFDVALIVGGVWLLIEIF